MEILVPEPYYNQSSLGLWRKQLEELAGQVKCLWRSVNR